MGWEWHDRHRVEHGRFGNLGKKEQIHVRCTLRERELIQADARACRKSMSRYLLDLAAQAGQRKAGVARTMRLDG